MRDMFNVMEKPQKKERKKKKAKEEEEERQQKQKHPSYFLIFYIICRLLHENGPGFQTIYLTGILLYHTYTVLGFVSKLFFLFTFVNSSKKSKNEIYSYLQNCKSKFLLR